jgi:hypothetical protein
LRVNFVTRSRDHLASHRLRTLVAAEAFPGNWTLVGPYHPLADVHVFSKHWDPGELELAEASPCSVYDICDEHFTSTPDAMAAFPWIRDHYYRMCETVDVVTTGSRELARIIKEKTGREAVVIEEPYEIPERDAMFSAPPSLFWFGHRGNLKHLEAIADRIGEEVCYLTNPEWSPARQSAGLHWCDLVLLPQPERWKSANRAVTALRAGRYAVADPVDSYEGLCWTGGVLEGIEWVKQNPGSIIERIRSSQAIIRERFSPEKIRKQWYDCISAAVENTSPVS